MKDEQVFAKIRDILVEQLGVEADEVTLDSDFTDELNADSLDIVELIMAMEQEFGISIPDEDAERIRTVGARLTLSRTTPDLLFNPFPGDRGPRQRGPFLAVGRGLLP